MIDKIVHGGCHLVPKAHESNPNDDASWRYSFSQAELILIDTWNEVQKYIYHILRILNPMLLRLCKGDRVVDMNFFRIVEKDNHASHRKMSNAILSAAISVYHNTLP